MVWSRQFMAEAGYDPRAALDLWDLMAAVEADAASRGQPLSLSDRLSLLQTHPTSNVRQDVSQLAGHEYVEFRRFADTVWVLS